MNAELAPALAEIKAVLEKHNLVGLVMLTNQTHGDWLMKIDPPWTCAHFEGDELRIRCKRADYASAEEQKKHLLDTVASFVVLTDMLAKMNHNICAILEMLDENGVKFDGRNTTIEG